MDGPRGLFNFGGFSTRSLSGPHRRRFIRGDVLFCGFSGPK